MSAADEAWRSYQKERWAHGSMSRQAFHEGYRRALEDAADDWQTREWADAVNSVKQNTTPAYKLGVSQVVTEWLRARAAAVAPRETKD